MTKRTSEEVMLIRALADAADRIKELQQELSRHAQVVKNYDEHIAKAEDRTRAAIAGERKAEKALADQTSRITLAQQFAQITESMWKEACLKCVCGAYRLDAVNSGAA